MNDFAVLIVNTDLSRAQLSRLFNKPVRHNTMNFQKVVNAIRINLAEFLVGAKSILHFQNVFLWRKDGFSVDNRRDLLKRKRVVFNRERRMNGLDSGSLGEDVATFQVR